MAMAGKSQGMIMLYMGHRTLTAAQRYVHANTSDLHAISADVFA